MGGEINKQIAKKLESDIKFKKYYMVKIIKYDKKKAKSGI